jgi:hypothetical protein
MKWEGIYVRMKSSQVCEYRRDHSETWRESSLLKLRAGKNDGVWLIGPHGYLLAQELLPDLYEIAASYSELASWLGNENQEPLPLTEPISSDSAEDEIRAVCRDLEAMLVEKNRKYGNSALNPVRVFSKADPVEQIRVRLDDKLSRLRSAQTDEDEDPEFDLMGYLVLLRIAKRRQRAQQASDGAQK